MSRDPFCHFHGASILVFMTEFDAIFNLLQIPHTKTNSKISNGYQFSLKQRRYLSYTNHVISYLQDTSAEQLLAA